MIRKIIQFVVAPKYERGVLFFVLCDDGSMWSQNVNEPTWTRLPDIPQEEPATDGFIVVCQVCGEKHDSRTECLTSPYERFERAMRNRVELANAGKFTNKPTSPVRVSCSIENILGAIRPTNAAFMTKRP